MEDWSKAITVVLSRGEMIEAALKELEELALKAIKVQAMNNRVFFF